MSIKVIKEAARPGQTALASLQRNPLSEEPEAPAVTVAVAHRVDVLTVPVERLVIRARLLDAAALPGPLGPRLSHAGVPVLPISSGGRLATPQRR